MANSHSMNFQRNFESLNKLSSLFNAKNALFFAHMYLDFPGFTNDLPGFSQIYSDLPRFRFTWIFSDSPKIYSDTWIYPDLPWIYLPGISLNLSFSVIIFITCTGNNFLESRNSFITEKNNFLGLISIQTTGKYFPGILEHLHSKLPQKS